MDHQQQTQQTENIIIEMLEYLESGSEDEIDLDQITEKNSEEIKVINNDEILTEKVKYNAKTGKDSKTDEKPISTIARELKKLKQQLQWNTKEITFSLKKETESVHNTLENFYNSLKIVNTAACNEAYGDESNISSDFANLDWQYKLENRCRRNYSNSYTQEIYKAIYHDTAGHPPSGSPDYYQAAQNYAVYGKHFLDFPDNIQAVVNGKNTQNSAAETSNLMTNFGSCLYSKPNTAATTTTATSAAAAYAYYQICNSMQAQARPTLNTNPANPTSYGIFLGNKVTYVAATAPTTPSLIYNQHNTTATTNFISNSLANAALATSPTILYTNPMLTTNTQQYLTQFLSTASLTANSIQSAAVATNGVGGVYERLVYAQMLQQHLYQAQQAAAVAAMFQHKQRVAVAAAAVRHSSNVMTLNTNRSSPQHLTATQTATNTTNGFNLSTTCNRQARSTSPSALIKSKLQSPIAVATTEISNSTKSAKD